MKTRLLTYGLLASTLLLFSDCNKNPTDNSFSVFSIDKDISLGRQLQEEIASNPTDYPVLDEGQYPEAYAHIRRIRDNILDGGQVFYADKFEWEVRIIHDDAVLNAFAAPGGFIYVYTGLIKFLDNEYELAGVMGHEIAHADRRHSTDQMTKQYGLQFMLDAALGNNQGALSDIATGLVSLSFSRSDEAEADEYSVIYLCPTEYRGDGAAIFFEKIEASGGGGTPVFLSTHPSPDSRVENIKAKSVEINCQGEVTAGQYADLISSLP